jgi:transcriptional regulatory protein RtcR
MSTLFGHVRGAFTGAVGERPGLLRAAEGGLLFLDEVGELGLEEQAMLLRAVEERRFLPVGSDKEAKSDFQLIAGTNCDLLSAARAGRFREDLLARINLWTFKLPALRDRLEDIEPNLDYELEQFARLHQTKVTFNKEARERFLHFATGPEATWSGNFRDLNAAVIRMATLSAGGRISVDAVDHEIARLQGSWAPAIVAPASFDLESVCEPQMLSKIDPFDRVQLADAVSVCRNSRTLSEAGRKLFAVSRAKKENPNDADRLRKYLARFGLTWGQINATDG